MPLDPTRQQALAQVYESLMAGRFSGAKREKAQALLNAAAVADPEFLSGLRQARVEADPGVVSRASGIGPTETWSKQALLEGVAGDEPVHQWELEGGLSSGIVEGIEAIPILGGIVDPLVKTKFERADAGLGGQVATGASNLVRNIGEVILPGGVVKGLARAGAKRGASEIAQRAAKEAADAATKTLSKRIASGAAQVGATTAAQAARETGLPIPGQEDFGQNASEIALAGLFGAGGVPVGAGASAAGRKLAEKVGGGFATQLAAELPINAAYDIPSAGVELANMDVPLDNPAAWGVPLAASVAGSIFGAATERGAVRDAARLEKARAEKLKADAEALKQQNWRDVQEAKIAGARGVAGFREAEKARASQFAQRGAETGLVPQDMGEIEPPGFRQLEQARTLAEAREAEEMAQRLAGTRQTPATVTEDPLAGLVRADEQAFYDEARTQLPQRIANSRTGQAQQLLEEYPDMPDILAGRAEARTMLEEPEWIPLPQQQPEGVPLSQTVGLSPRPKKTVKAAPPPPTPPVPPELETGFEPLTVENVPEPGGPGPIDLETVLSPEEMDAFYADARRQLPMRKSMSDIQQFPPEVAGDYQAAEAALGAGAYQRPPPRPVKAPSAPSGGTSPRSTATEPRRPSAPATGPQFENVPVQALTTREGDFQMREGNYSKATAQSVYEKGLDPSKSALKPIRVWEDPANGELVVLSGHSRLAGVQRRIAEGMDPEDSAIPVIVERGIPYEDAVKVAAVSNVSGDTPNIVESGQSVRMMTDKAGLSFEEAAREMGLRNAHQAEVLAKIASFPNIAKEVIVRGEVNDRAAEALASAALRHNLVDPVVEQIALKIARGELNGSSRAVEAFARSTAALTAPKMTGEEVDMFGGIPPDVDMIATAISKATMAASQAKNTLSRAKKASGGGGRMARAIKVSTKEAERLARDANAILAALDEMVYAHSGMLVKHKNEALFNEVQRRVASGEEITVDALDGFFRGGSKPTPSGRGQGDAGGDAGSGRPGRGDSDPSGDTGGGRTRAVGGGDRSVVTEPDLLGGTEFRVGDYARLQDGREILVEKGTDPRLLLGAEKIAEDVDLFDADAPTVSPTQSERFELVNPDGPIGDRLPGDVELYLDRIIQYNSRQAAPSEGGRGLSVGARGIEFRWREGAVRDIRDALYKGSTLFEAGEIAKEKSRAAIDKHNKNRPNDINWQRWDGTSDNTIEQVVGDLKKVLSGEYRIDERGVASPAKSVQQETTDAPKRTLGPDNLEQRIVEKIKSLVDVDDLRERRIISDDDGVLRQLVKDPEFDSPNNIRGKDADSLKILWDIRRNLEYDAEFRELRDAYLERQRDNLAKAAKAEKKAKAESGRYAPAFKVLSRYNIGDTVSVEDFDGNTYSGVLGRHRDGRYSVKQDGGSKQVFNDDAMLLKPAAPTAKPDAPAPKRGADIQKGDYASQLKAVEAIRGRGDIPIWQPEWSKIDGVEVLRFPGSRYAAAPSSDRRDSRQFIAFDVRYRKELAILSKKEVAQWLVDMARGEENLLPNTTLAKSDAEAKSAARSRSSPKQGKRKPEPAETAPGLVITDAMRDAAVVPVREYLELERELLADQGLSEKEMASVERSAAARHKSYVEKVLSTGTKLPPEVLADYPDLAEKYGKGDAGTARPAASAPLARDPAFDNAPADKGASQAEIDALLAGMRGGDKDAVSVPQDAVLRSPIKGKGTDAKIVGYKWSWTDGQKYSSREDGLVDAKVSDWSNAATSEGTGRNIVHQYYVDHGNGKITVEGINSAQKILGISEDRLRSIAKNEQEARQNIAAATKRESDRLESVAFDTPALAARDYRKQNASSMRSAEANNALFNQSVLVSKGGKYLRMSPESADVFASQGWTRVENDPVRASSENQLPPNVSKILAEAKLTPASGASPAQLRNIVRGAVSQLKGAANKGKRETLNNWIKNNEVENDGISLRPSLAQSAETVRSIDPKAGTEVETRWMDLDAKLDTMREAIRATLENPEGVKRGREAVLQALDDAEVSGEAREATVRVLDRMPEVFDDLAAVAVMGDDAPSGGYQWKDNVVAFAKAFDRKDPQAAIEELFHSVERFLDPQDRRIVLGEYARALSEKMAQLKGLRDIAVKNKDTEAASVLSRKIEYLKSAAKGDAPRDGIPADLYYLRDPSEFFAKSMTDMEWDDFSASSTLFRRAAKRAKAFLREAWQAIKEVFGIESADSLEKLWRRGFTTGERPGYPLMLDSARDWEDFLSREVKDDILQRPQKPLPPGVQTTIEKVGGVRVDEPAIVAARRAVSSAATRAGDKIVQNLIDGNYTMKAVSLEGYQALQRAQNSGQVLGYMLSRGSVKLDSDGILRPDGRFNAAEDILAPAAKDGMTNHVMVFMAGKRAEEELARSAQQLTRARAELARAQASGNNRDIASAQKAVASAQAEVQSGKKSPYDKQELAEILAMGSEKLSNGETIEQVAKKMTDWTHQGLDLLQDSGMIDNTSRKEFERVWYTPFFRERETKLFSGEEILDVIAPVGKGGIVDQSSGIYHYTGSDKKMADLMENMMSSMFHSVSAAMKNVAAQKALSDFEAAGVATKLTPDAVPQKAIDRREQGIVSVMRNGKREFYQVADPMLYQALNHMGRKPYEGALRLFMSPFKFAKRVLTNGVTLAPDFLAVNVVRDALNAWGTTGERMIPFASVLRALGAEVYKELPRFVPFMKDNGLTREANALVASGSGGGGYYGEGGFLGSGGLFRQQSKGEVYARSLKKKSDAKASGNVSKALNLLNPFTMIEFLKAIGEAGERASRVATYRAARKRGAPEKEALWEAQNLINYNTIGAAPIMGVFADIFPFFQPRVAGLYRLGQAGAKAGKAAKDIATFHKPDAQGRRILTRGLFIGGLSAALTAYNWSENTDEMDALEEFEKDSNWNFWVTGADGKKAHYKMPKPFEYGLMFGTAPERMVGFIHNESTDKGDGELVWERFNHAIGETLNMPGLADVQLIKPYEEVQRNQSFFSGRPIITPSQEGLFPEQQFSASTTRTARGIAEAMPDFASDTLRSPKKIETLVRGYLGTMGMYALMGGDVINDMNRKVTGADVLPGAPQPTAKTDRWPVIRRFFEGVDDDTEYTRYMARFYEDLAETSKATKSVRELYRTGNVEQARKLGEKYRMEMLLNPMYVKAMKGLSELNLVSRQISESKDLSPEEKRDRLDRLTRIKNSIAKQTDEASRRVKKQEKEKARQK